MPARAPARGGNTLRQRLIATGNYDIQFYGGDTMVIEGDFITEVEPLENAVQVEVAGSVAKWTYDAGDMELLPGDMVYVPFGNESRPGRVVAMGRGAYTGPLRFVHAPLVPARTEP